MATLATLQTWLSEAEIARHKLRTGSLRVSFSHGQRSMTFAAANATELDAYIADLAQQITVAQGGSSKRRVFRVMQTGTGY